MCEARDHVSVSIDNILLSLPTLPCKPTIFRVDDELRNINQKLYEPKLLSIGPFHYREDHLLKMKQHKFRYLKLLLKRLNQSSVDKYVMAMRSLETKARRCYAEAVELGPDEFVEMLILDGCFIIELIRKYKFDEWRDKDDRIFHHDQVLSQVRHDMMLVENQVPFFVIDQLFSMTRTGDPEDALLFLIQLFIDDIPPWPEASQVAGQGSVKNVDHLLGLVHKIWCSSFAKMTKNRPPKEKTVAVNSTSELQEAGIKFRKDTKSNSLDIKFTRGTMTIPGFTVTDETESFFSNIIAYEHFFTDSHPRHITDYAFFLLCLINSSKDVEILRRRGILTNLLGDDEMVHHMFNRLGRNILLSSDFGYSDVYEKVNGYCHRRGNRWMAILGHKYFHSPWAVISFLAAVMLLLFTLTQTVFSVLSYLSK